MRPLTTIKIFGIYSFTMGFVLLLIPHLILPAIGFSITPDDAWIRLLGFVLCCSSYYYIRSAYAGNLEFAKYTVQTRLAAPVFVIALVLSGKADWHFFPFGIVDGFGGIWTWLELRKMKTNKKMSRHIIRNVPGK